MVEFFFRMVEYLKKYRQIETQLRDGRKIYRGVKSRGLG